MSERFTIPSGGTTGAQRAATAIAVFLADENPRRVAIARIVDPMAWACHDGNVSTAARWEAYGEPKLGSARLRHEAREAVAPSLAKADAIMALEPEPTAS